MPGYICRLRHVHRVILACLVLRLFNRKVASALLPMLGRQSGRP
jgi:hypothetical protein